MAQLAIPTPTTMKDIVCTVGDDDIERQISEVRITPTSSTLTWQGCSPDATFTDQTSPTWAMTVTAAQDWDDEASFVNWLMDNAGETEIPVTLRPRRGGAGWDVVIASVTAPAIGGAQGAVATAQVTMGLVGKPTRAAAPTP